MQEVLHIIGIICAVLAGAGLVISVLLFIRFDVPTLWKDRSGQMSQKEIDKIRQSSNNRDDQINVFEELEKKAKRRSGNTTSSLQRGTGFLNRDRARNTAPSAKLEEGTSVLTAPKNGRPDFVIEKSIRFVSTNEIL